MKPDVFILAGGNSRRMGADKALVVLPSGRSMLGQLVDAVRPVSERITVVRRHSQQPLVFSNQGEVLPVVHDGGGVEPHPLWGVEVALRTSTTDYALILACDIPFVPTGFLRRLLENTCPEGAVASAAGRVHPLVGLYPTSLAGAARDGALAGVSMRAFSSACAQIEGEPEWFRNVNAPTDLPS